MCKPTTDVTATGHKDGSVAKWMMDESRDKNIRQEVSSVSLGSENNSASRFAHVPFRVKTNSWAKHTRYTAAAGGSSMDKIGQTFDQLKSTKKAVGGTHVTKSTVQLSGGKADVLRPRESKSHTSQVIFSGGRVETRTPKQDKSHTSQLIFEGGRAEPTLLGTDRALLAKRRTHHLSNVAFSGGTAAAPAPKVRTEHTSTVNLAGGVTPDAPRTKPRAEARHRELATTLVLGSTSNSARFAHMDAKTNRNTTKPMARERAMHSNFGASSAAVLMASTSASAAPSTRIRTSATTHSQIVF